MDRRLMAQEQRESACPETQGAWGLNTMCILGMLSSLAQGFQAARRVDGFHEGGFCWQRWAFCEHNSLSHTWPSEDKFASKQEDFAFRVLFLEALKTLTRDPIDSTPDRKSASEEHWMRRASHVLEGIALTLFQFHNHLEPASSWKRPMVSRQAWSVW